MRYFDETNNETDENNNNIDVFQEQTENSMFSRFSKYYFVERIFIILFFFTIFLIILLYSFIIKFYFILIFSFLFVLFL